MQSSFKTDTYSTYIYSLLLSTPNIHQRIYKIPPLGSILNHMNPVHTKTFSNVHLSLLQHNINFQYHLYERPLLNTEPLNCTSYLKIHFNIILQSHCLSSKKPLS